MNYSRLARLEWIQLLLFTFASPFVEPFLFLTSPYPVLFFAELIRNSIPAIVLYITIYVCGAFIVAQALSVWRTMRLGIKADPLPSQSFDDLKSVLVTHSSLFSRMSPGSILLNARDLRMGAHVRGVIVPKIVISGGLFVGLMQNNRKAISIFSHEIAHIRHSDLLIPGFIGASVLEVVGTSIKAFISFSTEFNLLKALLLSFAVLFYKFFVSTGLLWILSRNREFYADAFAVEITKDSDSYKSLLNSVVGREQHRWSFFHPSLSKRALELASGFKVIRRAVLWRLYFVCATLVSYVQWHFSDLDNNYVLIYFSTLVMGIIVLLSEMLRNSILKSKDSTELGRNKPRTLSKGNKLLIRWTFLLVGYTTAVIVGEGIFSSHNMAMILGGLVFVLGNLVRYR